MKSCKIEGLAACLEEEILKPYAAYCSEGMEAGITKTMKRRWARRVSRKHGMFGPPNTR